MRGAALLLLAVLLVPLAARADDTGPRLVTEFDLPADAVRQLARAPSPDAQPWASEPLTIDARRNPYSLVVTISGRARDAGQVSCGWLAAWIVNGVASLRQPLSGCARDGLAAGERFTLGALGGVTTFREPRELPMTLVLARAANMEVEAVHVQVWSGALPSSRRRLLLAFVVMLVSVVVLFMWWQKNRS